MNSTTHKLLIISILTTVLFTSNSLAVAEDELLMGSVAMDIPAVMYKRLHPLTEYLSKTIGLNVSLKLSPNMKEAINEVATNNVHISYLTPVAYIKAHEKGQARLVAKTITKGQSSFQLMIVVRQDSQIKSVADLDQKRFAFGDPAALLQRAVVVEAGHKLDQFAEVKYLGHYDNIARGVKNGDFDAGILKDTLVPKWQDKGLRVIYASPALPPYNIVVNGELADPLFQKIKSAFLNLNPKNPTHLKIIKSLDKRYTGFARTTDTEYDIVRELVAPFVQ
ncbi:Phosphonate ABC transporter phosphate-binding periplasmic component (TC 3.A.1.9.1) [hydrothermal vent metagenome]|uniref:Phosphonate ABC transporter phosphate-binding periplasmic component (TC 3.A.1.9.1) n=1 Tax=hydrothermal vent metagenome TaxID=652676 RepID=A0A3B0ZY12_9ZZZZ